MFSFDQRIDRGSVAQLEIEFFAFPLQEDENRFAFCSLFRFPLRYFYLALGIDM